MNSDDNSLKMMDSPNNTRRQFVTGTAGALGGLAIGAGAMSSVSGEEHDDEEEHEEEEEDEYENDEPMENEFEDDVDILNYARTLELLEADFYRQGLENISEEQLCTCNMLKEDSALADRAYGELETIQEHEETHADVLADVIEDLGGEPVEDLEFDFGLRVEYAEPFLATAAMLEDIGVSAYAGAAPYIENEELVAPALSIHSVEARHASFVRTLNNDTGYPMAFDEARTRAEVMELAAPFIVDMDEDEHDDDMNGEDDDDMNGEDDDTGTETDDDTGNGTDDDTGNGTDDDTGNGTDDDTGNGTDDDTGNGTGNGTDDDEGQ